VHEVERPDDRVAVRAIVHLDLQHLGEKLIVSGFRWCELCLKYERIDPVKELIRPPGRAP
jgi:hypothetical protein